MDFTFAKAGRQRLKNIAKPVEIWLWPPEHAGMMRRVTANWRQVAVFASLALVAVAAILYFARDPAGEGGSLAGPRIAIIPFKNLGSSPDDAFFSEGLTRDINAHLSRFSNLFVIAPAAGTKYRDNVDCEKIRSDLNAEGGEPVRHFACQWSRVSKFTIWTVDAPTGADDPR